MRVLCVISILCLSALNVFSTHNRAGEISYKLVSPFTYEITITTCTKESSTQADRCELEIKYGDGDVDTIARVNGPQGPECNLGVSIGGGCINDIKLNKYVTTHTYPGPGSYTVTMEDPNRNADILNIPGSVNSSFFIYAEIVVSPFLGYNQSPELTQDHVQDGCVFEIYEHSPGAVDADGDVLAYSIVPCLGTNGVPLASYIYPDSVSGCQSNSFGIDPVTGIVTWDSPQCQGEYNICIRIEEHRNGVFIGAVVRDMQITICDCDNSPPVIQPLTPICVIAGDTINQVVTATDIDNNLISLTAYGEVFDTSLAPPAVFDSVAAPTSVSQQFYWETNCSHVRLSNYQAGFKADDNHPIFSLVDYESFFITVISPEPENLIAIPMGNAISLSWDPVVCDQAIGYNIFRKIDSSLVIPDTCETGVQAAWGYVQIGSTNSWSSTSFSDNDNALVPGQIYCYRIEAFFGDGALSRASDEVCAELQKDLPVMTHVSVVKTDVIGGIDSVIWSKPIDSLLTQFTPPFYYKVYRDGIFQDSTNVGLQLNDTIYVDSLMDTKNLQHTYYIDLYDSSGFVGSSNTASSIFLNVYETDNRIDLSWQENVPWTNYDYVVYRFNSGNSNWDILDTVPVGFYSDSDLENGEEQCYFVKSIGEYTTSGFLSPLINNSQENCGTPFDNVPPCPPDLVNVMNDCDLLQNLAFWTDTGMACSEDVEGYYLSYSAMPHLPMVNIDSLQLINDTFFLHSNLNFVSGCYSVQAIDTTGNISGRSDTICVDNCPEYELPNVFTPGGDGFNDLFRPLPYRFVIEIHLQMFNRWGQKVFETTDPEINWDGTLLDTGSPLPDGVYYYLCTVHEVHVNGIETRLLKGYVHLFREGSTNGNSN